VPAALPPLPETALWRQWQVLGKRTARKDSRAEDARRGAIAWSKHHEGLAEDFRMCAARLKHMLPIVIGDTQSMISLGAPTSPDRD
jgi:hypothetical protein